MIIRKHTKLHRGDQSRPRRCRPSPDFRSLPLCQKVLFSLALNQIRQYSLAPCYAFGSRTHGTWNEQSDIDVMIDCKREEYERLLQLGLNVNGIRIDLQLGKPSRLAEIWQIR